MTKHEDQELRSFFTYDVFLSFRGEDTRHRFIGHLRRELARKGINTFVDDENLKIGENISPALSKAIEDSNISIVVFSENYANSSWCLAELAKILDCMKKNSKQLVVPIFYHVDPSDVRKQKNRYEDAMIEHENKFGKDSEKVLAWRSALSEVANLKGHHISTGYESIHIEKIAKDVYAKIAPAPLEIGEDLVGLEQRIEEVISCLDMKLNKDDDKVSMLGIHGLGGIGKTMLAKALFNRIAYLFEDVSFLEDAGEMSKGSITDLQKKLLSEMNEQLETELGSAARGMSVIKRKLHEKKVLLVLDDVVDIDNLKHLAGGRDWFGPGSRIVITTRDKKLLESHQVEHMYKMTELNDQHALELFCRNAFFQSYPETGYETVAARVVGYAKGLPLALKVIGSDLATNERSICTWESILQEYERVPNARIQDVLKISYDRLGDNNADCKRVFLDIACFFKGEKKDYVEKILKEYGASYHITVLVNKSLLTIEYGCLKMHDLIQDMGRGVVRNEASEPGKRSRIWFYQDAIDVLNEDLGSDTIEGIMLDPPEPKQVVDWSGDAFEKMKYLRILIVRNTSFSPEPKHLPNNLRLLDWKGYPSKSLPPKFHPKKIIYWNLPESKLILDEPFKKYSCLTSMNLSHGQSIVEIPDLSEVENLREVKLDNCRNLTAIHESFGFLKDLARVSASNCSKLKVFLLKMYLPSLEVLDLNLCARLEHFPDVTGQMNKALKIFMNNTAIKMLPDSIGNLIGLECIEMTISTELRYLPSSLFMLPNVATFKIEGCSQLQECFRRFRENLLPANDCPKLKTLYFGNGGLSDEDLHIILNCFPNLKELIAPENNFESLPACIKESVNLTTLDVSDCRELKRIPECTNLTDLDVHYCVNLEEISELPSTIQKVDARNCRSLSTETSSMLWCQVLKEISGLEMVMPETEIPNWFDYKCEGGNPRFWARGKFPVIALALVFHGDKESGLRRQLVELHLVINGRCVPRKGYHRFKIARDHVLICDLRLLFSKQEWLGLDAFLKERDWNQIQVSYEANSSLTLTSWGIFASKKGTNNMEDVQFMSPDDSDILAPTTVVPAKDPNKELIKMIEELALDMTFARTLKEYPEFIKKQNVRDEAFAEDCHHMLMEQLHDLSSEAKIVLESKDEASRDLLGNKNSTLLWLLDQLKKGEDMRGVQFHNGLALIPLKPGTDVSKGITVEDMEGESSSTSTSRVKGKSSTDIDPQQQKILTELFYDGIIDGLLQAQSHFPDLDVDTTATNALNKGNSVSLSWPFPVPIEKNTYMEGFLSGLREAKLSFPDLDVQGIFNAKLIEGGEGLIASPPSTSGVKGKITSIEPGELHDGDPLQQEEMLTGIFYNGIMDGLVQAKSDFPDLDVDTTAINALNKGNRVFWHLRDPSMLMPPDDRRTYIEGIINGLFEAKLSFPDLDEPGILHTVLRRGGGGLIQEPSPSSTSSSGGVYLKLKEEHSVLRKKLFENDETATLVVDDDASSFPSWKKQYAEELLQKFNISRSDDGNISESKLLSAVLKGREEELQRIESQELQDLRNTIYLNGLRDGILEARAMLLALNMDTVETPLPFASKEINEEPVIVGTTPQDKVTEVPPVDNPPPASDDDDSGINFGFLFFG